MTDAYNTVPVTFQVSIATDQSSSQKAYTVSTSQADNKFRESGVYQMHQDDQRDLDDRKRYLEYGW